jgi:hypothetical protein
MALAESGELLAHQAATNEKTGHWPVFSFSGYAV